MMSEDGARGIGTRTPSNEIACLKPANPRTMALIKCEDCGREVSDKAIACPACGCPPRVAAPLPTVDQSLASAGDGRSVDELCALDGGDAHPIPRRPGIYSVGTSRRCDIVISDVTVGELHCQIERRADGSVIVVAAEPSNPVVANGRLVRSFATLKVGAVLELGRARLHVQSASSVGAAASHLPPDPSILQPSRDFHSVLALIECWRPGRNPSWAERNYSDALKDLLNARFPLVASDVPPVRRRARGRRGQELNFARRSKFVSPRRDLRDERTIRRRPDIRIATATVTTYVELKLDLRSSAEMARLIEQIDDILVEEQRRLIVVLMGDTRSEFVDELREFEEETRTSLPDAIEPSRRLRVVRTPF